MKSIYFNKEHDELRQNIRKFVEKEMIPYELEWEEKGLFPVELYKKMGDLGFLGIKFDEKYGGLGLDYFSNVVFIEELSRTAGGAALGIMTHTDIAATAINLLGTEAQKEKYLIPSITGDLIGALGVTEPNHGSDVGGIETTAKKDGDYYIVNGSKLYITNGSRADYIILGAKTNPELGHKGISLFILDTKSEGFKVSKKLEKVGQRASDTVELSFDNVKIHKDNLLGEENKGFYYIMHNFQGERLSGAIMAYAMAEKVWEDTYKYCNEREAFGQKIAKFQVNSHKLVDMLTEIEAGKHMTLHACWLFGQGIECSKEISIAKLFCGEMSFRVINQALQLHGGAGYMLEYPVQRFWRDCRVISIGGGTSEIMKEIISKKL